MNYNIFSQLVIHPHGVCFKRPECAGDLHGGEVAEESDGEDGEEGYGHEDSTVHQRRAGRNLAHPR